MSFSGSAKLIKQLNALCCTLAHNARHKPNLNVTSLLICVMHVIMHACNMYVAAAHGNYSYRALASNFTLSGLQYCIYVHVPTLSPGSYLAQHTPRELQQPCVSYKLFEADVNKQCKINKAHKIKRRVCCTTNNGK